MKRHPKGTRARVLLSSVFGDGEGVSARVKAGVSAEIRALRREVEREFGSSARVAARIGGPFFHGQRGGRGSGWPRAALMSLPRFSKDESGRPAEFSLPWLPGPESSSLWAGF